MSINKTVMGINTHQAKISDIASNAAKSNAVGGRKQLNFHSTFNDKQITGGVESTTHLEIDQRATAIKTGINTHLYIDGSKGKMIVRGDNTTTSELEYTDIGTFKKNQDGYYRNHTDKVMQYIPQSTLDNNTTFSAGDLVPLNVKGLISDPTATTALNTSIVIPGVNQNGTAFAVNDTIDIDFQVYDSLGVLKSLSMTLTKIDTDPNAAVGAPERPIDTANTKQRWVVTISDPGNAAGFDAGSYQNGVTIEFNGSGRVVGFQDGAATTLSTSAPNLTINWGANSESNDSTIDLNLGDTTDPANGFNKITIASNKKSVRKSLTPADGNPPGDFTRAEFGKDGDVVGVFTNGNRVTLGKLALATFSNPNGLEPIEGGSYLASTNSGSAEIVFAQDTISSSFKSGHREGSTADGSESLIELIPAQNGYSINVKMLTSQKDITERLINAT